MEEKNAKNFPEMEYKPTAQTFELPEDAGSLGLLQSIYRSSAMPLSVRMRAAIEALPFEHPKLSVTTSLSGGDFADRLDRAMRRSRQANEPLRMIEDHRQS